jgi:peptidoglycan-associated lipoprotein
MTKKASLAVLLLGFLMLFTGCPRTQGPTPSDTAMGGPSARSGDVLSGMDAGAFGLDGSEFGLEDRSGSNLFDGREMVRGVLEPVFFGFDQSSIGQNERPKLNSAAEYMRANPNVGLLVEGHCDWHGTAEYNLALGDRRARAARDFLVNLGIDGSRIETLSKGDLEATPGLSQSEGQRDRRAELIILR